MKNHDDHIMYALWPISAALYMHICAMENLQFISKHPVAMNLVFLDTSPPPAYSVIKFRCFACILFANQAYALCVVFSRKPRLSRITALVSCLIRRVQDKYKLRHGNLPNHKEERVKQ